VRSQNAAIAMSARGRKRKKSESGTGNVRAAKTNCVAVRSEESARLAALVRAIARGTVSPFAVNPSSASPVSCAPPCLLAPTEEARWFKEEIRPHERELRAYLRGRFPTLQDVDDLVQETYARLWRARQGGQATLTRAYLFVIARNVALDLVRRNKVVSVERLGDIEELSVVEERPDAAETLSHEQELALLADAMRALPPRCREILTLRRIEGLSHREISAKLGIAEGTVNAQLAIGVMRCRQYLCDHGVARACFHVPAHSATHVR
jgi:RNA polymerase sigma factor (sigma-70 family)